MTTQRFSWRWLFAGVCVVLMFCAGGAMAAVNSPAEEDAQVGGELKRLYLAKQYTQALELATKAAAERPDLEIAHYYIGVCKLELGDNPGAIAAFDRALKLSPNAWQTHLSRGLALSRQGDIPAAIEAFGRAAAADPTQAQPFVSRGVARAKVGDLKGSLADLDHALALAPKSATALAYRGTTREKLGDREGARGDWEQTLAIDPSNAAAKAGLERFAQTAAPASAAIVAPERTTVQLPRDPAKPGNWNNGDMLWTAAPRLADARASTASATPAVEPLPVAPLNVDHLSLVAFNGAITTAKEAMRLVMGPMSPAEEQRFETKWAPYYDHPDDEIVAYLNQLSPLLADFIAGRSSFASASQGFMGCLTEAAGLEAAEDIKGVRTAMANAQMHRNLMDAAQARMTSAAEAILALGGPPDAFKVKARRRKAYQDELAKLPRPKPLKPQDLFWVLEKSSMIEEPKRGEILMDSRTGETFNQTKSAPGRFIFERRFKDHENPFKKDIVQVERVRGSVEWKPGTPPMLFPYEANYPFIPVRVRVKVDECVRENLSKIGNQIPLAQLTITATDGSSKQAELPAGKNELELTFAESDWNDNKPDLDYRTANEVVVATRLSPALQREEDGVRRSLGIHIVTPAGRGGAIYTYRLMKLTPELRTEYENQQIDKEIAAEKSVAQSAQKAAAESAQAAADTLSREQKAAVEKAIDDNIRYLETQYVVAKDAAAKEKDPASRSQLEFQMMSYDAYRRAALDEKQAMATGIYVRTRTMADEWNMREMMRHSEDQARTIASIRRLYNSANTLINYGPPEGREDLRAFYNREIGADFSPEHVREVTQRLGERVREDNQRDYDVETAKGNRARAIELGLEGTKMVAGIAVCSLGGTALAGMQLSSYTVMGAEMVFGAAYGGATGYAEGGPDQAMKQSLEWAGTVGFVASQTLDAWAATGNEASAAKAGVGALLLGKTFELGGKWVTGKMAATFGSRAGREASEAAERTARPGINGSDALEIQQFMRGMTDGKQLAQRWQKTEWELAEAISRGRPTEEVSHLTDQVRQQSLEIGNNWYAKLSLKAQGRGVGGASYCERIEREVQDAIPDVLTILKDMGYDTSKLRFRPMRNASSAGTAGMDMDLALDEAFAGQLTRNGQPVDMAAFNQSAQEALNRVWQARTGYSAEQSFMIMTTSAHREAFANTLLLQAKIPWDRIPPADIRQAAEVMRVKVLDVELPGMAGFVERCRGMEKEMRTKFMPYIENRIEQATAQGNQALVQELKQSQSYWTNYYNEFKVAAKQGVNPIAVADARQRLRVLSGGREPLAIADELLAIWTGFANQ